MFKFELLLELFHRNTKHLYIALLCSEIEDEINIMLQHGLIIKFLLHDAT